jgi:predicted deacylase
VNGDTATADLVIGGVSIPPGRRESIELPIARLVTGSMLTLPVVVVRGDRPGPAVWLSGALHGDEVDGMEIIRRALDRVTTDSLAGTLVAAPIVNVFGFVAESRYLPDRRDLNRSFPGSANGSLAARLAHLFMTEVVDHCDYGIDLHSGSDDRANLPQVRGDLDDTRISEIAHAFGAPVTVHVKAPAGSLRAEAARRGARTVVYEAGQARRFTAHAIDVGVAGVFNVLSFLGLIGESASGPTQTITVRETRWLRASRGGICRLTVELGQHVRKGEQLGIVADALGGDAVKVTATRGGVVLGRRLNPLVHRGEALIHIGVT